MHFNTNGVLLFSLMSSYWFSVPLFKSIDQLLASRMGYCLIGTFGCIVSSACLGFDVHLAYQRKKNGVLQKFWDLYILVPPLQYRHILESHEFLRSWVLLFSCLVICLWRMFLLIKSLLYLDLFTPIFPGSKAGVRYCFGVHKSNDIWFACCHHSCKSLIGLRYSMIIVIYFLNDLFVKTTKTLNNLNMYNLTR